MLWLHLFILSGVISWLISHSILDTYWPGKFIFQSYLFSFSYCSWGFQGKNTEVVCHSLLKWIIFCQKSPPWPIHLMWLYKARLIFSLISLFHFLWLWFSFWLSSDGGSWRRVMEEGHGSFQIGETDWGGTWVLFWWVGPCSVNLNPIFCW